MKKLFLFWFVLLASGFSSAAEVPPTLNSEVGYLLDYLEHSDCQFFRNGSWHTPKEARAHLTQKYEHFLTKGQLNKTEDFIEKAASQSSMSGQSYLVKCGNNNSMTSAQWFTDALKSYRKTQAVPAKKP